MKIVASNSLTVSNVNDGTITHTAYAYSADGTNRFTTVYPNLSLINTSDIIPYANDDPNFQKNKTRTTYLYSRNAITNNGLYINNFSRLSPNTTYTQTFNLTFTSGNVTDFHIFSNCSSVNNYSLSINETVVSTTQPALSGAISYPFTQNITYAFKIQFTTQATVTAGSYYGWILQPWKMTVTAYSLKLDHIKLEQGTVATPWMPSASEVTTTDWPGYIGQYSDFTATASTDPAKYAPWTVFKGNDGRGIVSSEQKYQLTQTSAKPVDPWDNSVWQTTQPTTTATNKYLWSITRTTFNLAPLTQDIVEQKAVYGNAGKDGDPGKIVSDTEPTTRFKGLTWKYSGTSDLTASDGTVINPNTEYYYNGTHWMINYLSANNLEANSITADLIDAKNLTITDGEFVSTIIDGPVQIQTEIKDDHLLIYKMDTSTNSINTIALKSDSGLAMTYQNSDTGEYTSAGVNFQGLFMQNNITNEFARLTPQGTKLSTDVPWTKLSLMNNFTGNIEYAIINGTVYISASGVGVPAMTAGQWKQAAQLPTGSSAIPIRANRITAGDSGDGLSWALLSNQAGGLFIRCSANKAATANLFNATLPYPIG